MVLNLNFAWDMYGRELNIQSRESHISGFALFTAIFSKAVYGGNFPTNDEILANAYLGTISFLQISELASMKQSKNSLQLPKPARNTRKISNLLTTIASGEISLPSKQDIICHVTKVKAATSAHSVAEAIPLF